MSLDLHRQTAIVSPHMTVTVSRRGVLLIGLGTPASPAVGDVRRFLHDMLSDPRVIDLAAPWRWLLVNFAILPVRPFYSAAAYRSIWTTQGSPLAVHSENLASKLRQALGEHVPVELAMRYGTPAMAGAIARLTAAGVTRLFVVPLFPQYSSAGTGSALAHFHRTLARSRNVPSVTTVGPFFSHSGFVAAWQEVARPALTRFRPDHVLFSFHGVPERHVRASDPTGRWCLIAANCCLTPEASQRPCYRAQCVATTAALSQALELDAAANSFAFQSRLGAGEWLQPYTVDAMRKLRGCGVRRLAVLCPSFVADCLETLEEIGLRGRKAWMDLGGEDFLLVPSLNEHPAWVGALTDILRDYGLERPGDDRSI